MKKNNFETLEEKNESKEIKFQSNTKEIDITTIQNDLSKLFNSIYEDNFFNILLKSKSSFLNSINTTIKEIISLSYSSYDLKNFFSKMKLSIENRYNKDYKILFKACKDIKNKKTEFNHLTNFIKHCAKTDNIAYHDCVNNKLNKYCIIQKNNEIKYIFCPECKSCFLSKCIRMVCIFCYKEYYSRILNHNENKNIFLANWNKYHCGSMKNHIMKCIQCKNNLYINLSNNTLICKNQNCNFSADPLSILWKCSKCGKDFRSNAKVYNLVELEIIKNAINITLLLKKMAFPKELPCCKKNTENMEFYHNNKCKGILYSGFLFDKKIVVCSLCHAMNFKEKFNWVCPLCNTKFHLHKFISINPFKSTKYIINRDNNSVNKNPNKRKINTNNIDSKTDISNNISINNYIEKINYFYNNSTDKKSFIDDTNLLSRENKKKKHKRIDSMSIDGNMIENKSNTKEKKYNTMIEILQKRKLKNNNNNKTINDCHYINEFTFNNSFNYNDTINYSNINQKNNIKSIQINSGKNFLDYSENIPRNGSAMIYHKKLSNYKKNKIEKINKCISQTNIFGQNHFKLKEKENINSSNNITIYKNKKINQKKMIINKTKNNEKVINYIYKNKHIINKGNNNYIFFENNIIPSLGIKKKQIYQNKIIQKNNGRISNNLNKVNNANKVNNNKIYSKTINIQAFPERIFSISRNCIIPDFNKLQYNNHYLV